jgi:hypothetical protein
MIPTIPFFQELLKYLKQYFQKIRKNFDQFSVNSPTTLQNIQLSFIYFFAFVDLLHSVLSNVFSLEYFPEILTPFFPLIKGIIFSPFFQIWASPEKVFFLSYIVIELMIIRSVFQFSKLIKYNILLIFALLMLQSLAVSYWDIFFHREVAIGVSRWAADQGALIYTDKDLAINFFLNTFLFFILLYLYCYIRGLQGKFVTIPTMEWLTDSIAFWLRVKTPTMRVGKRKKQTTEKIEPDQKEKSEEIEEIDLFEDFFEDDEPFPADPNENFNDDDEEDSENWKIHQQGDDEEKGE